MIPGLLILLLFQGLGELLSQGLGLPLPGPVVGLLLLLAAIGLRHGRVPPVLDSVAAGLTAHLGLLFVPASVGVITFLPELRAIALPLFITLLGSVSLTIAATATLAHRLSRPIPPARGRQENQQGPH